MERLVWKEGLRTKEMAFEKLGLFESRLVGGTLLAICESMANKERL